MPFQHNGSLKHFFVATTLNNRIYHRDWPLRDTATVFTGVSSECKALGLRLHSREPVSWEFRSNDEYPLRGETMELSPSSDGSIISQGSQIYANLPAWTDPSKTNSPWHLVVRAKGPDSHILVRVDYQCIPPGDYITLANSAQTLTGAYGLIVAILVLMWML